MKIRRNKLLSLIILVVCFFTMPNLRGCNTQKKNNSTDDYLIWNAPSTVKYMLDDIPVLSYSLFLEMSQNEYESVQLIVTPKKNVRSYEIEVSDLISAEKNVISKNNIELYVEKYIDVSTSTTNFRTGFYPDAIVPYDKVKKYEEDIIKQGQNQAFLITVKTEENTPAGIYNANVKIKLNNQEIKRQLTVKVRNFAISSESHTRTTLGFWTDMFMYQCDEVTDETIDNYLELALKYRMSSVPGKIGSLTFEEMIERYVKWLNKPCCSNLGIPFTTVTKKTEKGKTYYTFDKEYMRRFLTEIAKASTDENNLISKLSLSFSTYDEPKVSQYEFVSLVSQDFQNIKNELADDDRLFAIGVKDKVRESMRKIPNVTTLVAGYTEDLARDYNNGDYYGVDTWCTQYDYYDSAMNRYNIDKQIEKGDGAWFYGCVGPKNPYPSHHIDDNLLSARLLDWMMMEYNITGKLNWALNIWATYDGSYTYRDVWNDFCAFPGAAGDGYFMYPGDRYGMNTGIASIRMEAFRDGMEDYEALYVLKTLTNELARKYAVLDYDFNDSIKNLYRLLYNGTISTNKIDAFSKVRTQIFDLIEFAKNGILLDYEANYATGKIDVKVYTPSTVTEVSAENNSLSLRNSGEGKVWYGAVYCNSYLDVKIKDDKGINVLKRYVGAGITNLAMFNTQSDIDKVEVSDFSEYDGENDVKISLSDISEAGNALKMSMLKVDSSSYNPSISIPVSVDMTDVEGVRLYAYNPQEEPISITITLVDKNGKKDILSPNIAEPGKGGGIWFSVIENSSFDYTSVKLIKISVLPIKGMESYELYFDNIAFVRGGLDQ